MGEMQECYRSGEKIEYPELPEEKVSFLVKDILVEWRKSAAGSLQGWPAERF